MFASRDNAAPPNELCTLVIPPLLGRFFSGILIWHKLESDGEGPVGKEQEERNDWATGRIFVLQSDPNPSLIFYHGLLSVLRLPHETETPSSCVPDLRLDATSGFPIKRLKRQKPHHRPPHCVGYDQMPLKVWVRVKFERSYPKITRRTVSCEKRVLGDSKSSFVSPSSN